MRIRKKKDYISNLESSFIKLESEYKDLRIKYSILLSKGEEYNKLQDILRKKDSLILELEKELNKNKQNYENNKKEFDEKYQHDIKEVQYINGKLNIKNDNFTKIEKLNNLLYNHVLQLEEKILNFKNDEKKRIQEREIEYKKKINEIKKKMFDYIKEGKNLKDKNDQDIYNIIQKFSIMNHNTLLNELEFESIQLEDLLKQREHLDKIIMEMKSDLETHKKIEKMLVDKNKKYFDIIKFLSSRDEVKIKNKKINNKNILFNRIKKSNDIKNINLEKNEFNKTQSLMKINFINEEFKKMKRKYCMISNDKNKNENDNEKDVISLQKDIIKKSKTLEDLKSQNEYYQTKIRIINEKYKNIMSLFDNALEKIYEDKSLENIKDIFIDINEFKNCNFEQLTSKQRHTIIVLSIKHTWLSENEHTLPENIKNNIKTLPAKFYVNEEKKSFIKLKNSTSFYGQKLKISDNVLKEIKKNNINNIYQRLKGNISHETLRKSYSALFSNMNIKIWHEYIF